MEVFVMHSFQPMDLSYFNDNPFRLIGKDWMLITAEKDNNVNTMTASWGGMGVMWGKDIVFIAVRESRYTKEFIDGSDTFSLSFFNPEDKKIKECLAYIGSVSGRNENKIKKANMKINFHIDEQRNETPFIDEASMVLICKKMFAQKINKDNFIVPELANWYKDEDYHTLYIAEIQTMLAR